MGFRIVLTSALSLAFGLLYPAFASWEAIESSGSADDTQWLCYWLLYAILQMFESFTWRLLKWVPLYPEIKVAIIMWLVLPQTKGAHWLYEAVLNPTLRRARKELQKMPALERLLSQDHAPPPMHQGPDVLKADSVQRGERVEAAIKSAASHFRNESEHIAGIQDPQSRRRAERAFEKSLGRVEKLSGSSSGVNYSPLGSGTYKTD